MLIGIMGAMEEEIALLLEKLILKEEKVYAGIRFYLGKIYGQKVVICRSGVGKVNASLAAQILIDCFQAGCILFTGTAGAINPEINIGDIVISLQVQQYDMDFSALGYPPGIIPFMKTSIFNANDRLVVLAEQAAAFTKQKAFRGMILSGDRFVDNKEEAGHLATTFHGLCVEAEGAAMGQVCCVNKNPFVVIRAISDLAGGSAQESFSDFLKKAARNAQRVVLAMLYHWDK